MTPLDRTLDQILKVCNQKLKLNESLDFCDACQFGKFHLLPFRTTISHSTKHLDLIHTDLWGPSPVFTTFVSNTTFT